LSDPTVRPNSLPPPKAPDPAGLLVVISGPSGVGKTTVCQRLVQRLGAVLSISATTRPRAPREVHERDYDFITRHEFQRRIQAGHFLEHAEYLGHLYGTPAAPVHAALARGQIVLLPIEVQGAIQVAARVPHALLIYLLPRDHQTLSTRLGHRQRDQHDTIHQRLANADQEIRLARQCSQYQHFLVNDVLDDTIEQIARIIDRHRRTPAGPQHAARPAAKESRNHD
jgi:guanylate kinase